MKLTSLFLTLCFISTEAHAVLNAEMPKRNNENMTGLPELSLDRENAEKLTLEDSIQHAIHYATIVIKAKNSADLGGTQLLQGYAQFLPNLTVQAAYNYVKGTNYYTTATPTLVNAENYGPSYTVASDLNIFNGLADLSSLKSATDKKHAADLTLKRAKQQISLDVTQSYLQVVLDKQLVGIAEKNLERSKAREKLLQEQTKIGIKSLADLFRQQAQTSSDESFLLGQKNKIRTDQISLLRKLRIDVAKDYHFADPALPTDTDEKYDDKYKDEKVLIEHAVGERTDLHAANDVAEGAHWDVNAARSTYYPHLDLVGALNSSARYLNTDVVNAPGIANVDYTPASQTGLWTQLQNQVNWSVGLVLTWNIFDKLVTPLNVKKAAVVADNLDQDAQDFKRQVEGEVRQAYGDYRTSLEQLWASNEGFIAADKAYQVVQGRYNVGSSNFIDLVVAQAALVQAEATRAQAVIDFVLQGKTLEFALGDTVTEL